MTEAFLQDRVLNYFKELKLDAFSEVPLMSRVIDVVVLKDDTVITYELKIKKWKQAIEQMKEHRIASSFCILCMPKHIVSDNLREKIKHELDFFGFGFSLWDDRNEKLEEILNAKKSRLVSLISQKKLQENIEKIQ